eukprot:403367707
MSGHSAGGYRVGDNNTQLFPIFMPWYGDPNYEQDQAFPIPQPGNIMSRYRKKSQTYLIFSLFSVFVNNEWMTISEFIDQGCPFVMKGGYECLQYAGFQYASIGEYLALKLTSLGFQINNIIAMIQISMQRRHCNKKRGKIGALLLGAGIMFWLVCSGCFRNIKYLLISPLLDFVILIVMFLLCFHYNHWQHEFDKVSLINYYTRQSNGYGCNAGCHGGIGC